MSNVTKFPDLRPPKSRGTPALNLPTPAAYRRLVPVFQSTEPVAQMRLLRRKRYLMWFGVAVALHAALFLALWLSPPLRLPWSPSPDAWVQVTSLPRAEPAEEAKPAAAAPLQPKARSHKPRPAD